MIRQEEICSRFWLELSIKTNIIIIFIINFLSSFSSPSSSIGKQLAYSAKHVSNPKTLDFIKIPINLVVNEDSVIEHEDYQI